ncbi:MAG: hypothetical protein Tsb0027_18250 [Wenzhouxiangellaceae bacterium]
MRQTIRQLWNGQGKGSGNRAEDVILKSAGCGQFAGIGHDWHGDGILAELLWFTDMMIFTEMMIRESIPLFGCIECVDCQLG